MKVFVLALGMLKKLALIRCKYDTCDCWILKIFVSFMNIWPDDDL